MTDTAATLTFVDVDHPSVELPLNIQAHVIPAVGDSVHYFVDYPAHMPGCLEEGSVIEVKGIVAGRVVTYRHMDGWGSRPTVEPYVEVHLHEFEVQYYGEKPNDQ